MWWARPGGLFSLPRVLRGKVTHAGQGGEVRHTSIAAGTTREGWEQKHESTEIMNEQGENRWETRNQENILKIKKWTRSKKRKERQKEENKDSRRK